MSSARFGHVGHSLVRFDDSPQWALASWLSLDREPPSQAKSRVKVSARASRSLSGRGKGPLKSGGPGPAARCQRHGGIHGGKLASVTVGSGGACPV